LLEGEKNELENQLKLMQSDNKKLQKQLSVFKKHVGELENQNDMLRNTNQESQIKMTLLSKQLKVSHSDCSS
jgi:peptidoglycan hydrolase CwlO-like protein